MSQERIDLDTAQIGKNIPACGLQREVYFE